MAKESLDLSNRYGNKWQWKYSAMSHGKGVVDGEGGRAKSFVKTKVFSKRKDNVIVPLPLNFSEAAKELLETTTINIITLIRR